jgi:asparagine synthetase B (glutamine-hydrolysing)
VDLVLDGEGGDELFGCAPYLVADRLLDGRPLAALRTARRLPGMGSKPHARWLARAIGVYGARGALPYGVHERLRQARGRRGASAGWLGEETQRIHVGSEDPWAWKRVPGPRWWAHLAYTLTVTGDAMGAPDQLRRTARLAGLERRHPLRDQELIDLVLTLPPELAFHPRLDRPIARRALAGALPPELLEGDRKPIFNSLLADALDGPDAGALRDLLADPDPELARRVRMDAVAAMQGRASGSRTRGTALDLWRIASLEMWLEHRAEPSATRRFTERAGHEAVEFAERFCAN